MTSKEKSDCLSAVLKVSGIATNLKNPDQAGNPDPTLIKNYHLTYNNGHQQSELFRSLDVNFTVDLAVCLVSWN